MDKVGSVLVAPLLDPSDRLSAVIELHRMQGGNGFTERDEEVKELESAFVLRQISIQTLAAMCCWIACAMHHAQVGVIVCLQS